MRRTNDGQTAASSRRFKVAESSVFAAMEKDKDSSNPLIENDDEQVPLDLADGADGTLEHQTR